MSFDSSPAEREAIIKKVSTILEAFYKNTDQLPVSKKWDLAEVKQHIKQYDFQKPVSIEQVIEDVCKGLSQYAVHTPHPLYFGLFNPRAGFLSALADWITATFNPQMAAWSHAPFANEVERYVVQQFGEKIGYPIDHVDGTFCSGGAESNLTAVLCALCKHFPTFKNDGLIGLKKHPLIYCSSESHHSVLRAARVVGLGEKAVVEVPVLRNLVMDINWLEKRIIKDQKEGYQPFMLVGTAGTTGCGAIDDLNACTVLSKTHNLWFHVDAAYGGAVAISKDTQDWIAGIEHSDSFTLDLHKWFSTPMAASLFITRDKHILHHTFGINTAYMPKKGDQVEKIDPYLHSIQWSRRFIGLKIYLPLAVYGWEGFEAAILHQIEMGNLLKKRLENSGWIVKNDTQLPIACFGHPQLGEEEIQQLAQNLTAKGEAWISVYPIHKEQCLRACITNYITSKEDIVRLVEILNNELPHLKG